MKCDHRPVPFHDHLLQGELPADSLDGLGEGLRVTCALGRAPAATFVTGTLRDLIAVFADEAAVRAMRPDLAAVAALTRRLQLRAITSTAAADPGSGYDFVSRFFSPADGIPEDPVTGSAQTALAPYWATRLARDNLTGLRASARTGLVRTTINGDRVYLSGHAVTVLDGTLHHPPAGA